MSECALEGGRQKKSALSPESHTACREEGVQEREEIGKRIPAHHVSFPSDESCVLNKNYEVQLLLAAEINSWMKYAKDKLLRRPIKAYFSDGTITGDSRVCGDRKVD